MMEDRLKKSDSILGLANQNLAEALACIDTRTTNDISVMMEANYEEATTAHLRARKVCALCAYDPSMTERAAQLALQASLAAKASSREAERLLETLRHHGVTVRALSRKLLQLMQIHDKS